MKVPEIYHKLEALAMDLVSLDYCEESISDKLFDKVDKLYLNDEIKEDIYQQIDCKLVDSIIFNAKIKLNALGVI